MTATRRKQPLGLIAIGLFLFIILLTNVTAVTLGQTDTTDAIRLSPLHPRINGSGGTTIINNYYNYTYINGSSSNLTFQNTCLASQLAYYINETTIGCINNTHVLNNFFYQASTIEDKTIGFENGKLRLDSLDSSVYGYIETDSIGNITLTTYIDVFGDRRYINLISSGVYIKNNVSAQCYSFMDGSVQCSASTGSGSTSLTNVAWRNESNIFNGNITLTGLINQTTNATNYLSGALVINTSKNVGAGDYTFWIYNPTGAGRARYEGTYGVFGFRAIGAPSDEKAYQFVTNPSGQFYLGLLNDAESAETPVWFIDRSGTGVNYMNYNSPRSGYNRPYNYIPLGTLDVNGNITSQKIFPLVNNTYDLGILDKQWRSLYVTNITTNWITAQNITTKNITVGDIFFANGWHLTENGTAGLHLRNASGYVFYTFNSSGFPTGAGVGDGSYNATYDLWAYNQTTPFATWLSSFVYNYNQTTPAINYANTKALAGNCSAGQYAQNITVNGVQCSAVTASGDGSYNVSYALIGNCSAGQVVQNITPQGVQCVTPSGSSGSYNQSYPVMQVRYQNKDIDSINITTEVNMPWNQTQLSFPLSANKNYSMLCFLEYTSAVATTGLAINVTTTSTTSGVQIAYDTWSSATAKVGFSTTSFNTALIGTGSGAGVIYKSFIDADFNAHTAGTVNISIKSEVTNSKATLKRGSLCELMDVTGAMN